MRLLKTIILAALLMQSGVTLADACRWVDDSGGAVPPNAEVAGQDSDGSALYIARGRYQNGVHPGKVRPGLGGAHIGWGGNEITLEHYQVLVNPNECGKWVGTSGGAIPPDAIQGGHYSDGNSNDNPLFIARAPYARGMHPGKIGPGFNGANIGWGGKEQVVIIYQVLVARDAPDVSAYSEPEQPANANSSVWGCLWVKAENGRVPRDSEPAGSEADGRPLYIARAKYQYTMQPGKLLAGSNGASITWNGNQIIMPRYEVLVNPRECGRWVDAVNGSIPPNAFQAGFYSNDTSDGIPYYIARAHVHDSVQLGKIGNGFNGADIGWDGSEISVRHYEVFVTTPH